MAQIPERVVVTDCGRERHEGKRAILRKQNRATVFSRLNDGVGADGAPGAGTIDRARTFSGRDLFARARAAISQRRPGSGTTRLIGPVGNGWALRRPATRGAHRREQCCAKLHDQISLKL